MLSFLHVSSNPVARVRFGFGFDGCRGTHADMLDVFPAAADHSIGSFVRPFFVYRMVGVRFIASTQA